MSRTTKFAAMTAAALMTAAAGATALPPLEDNPRIMHELVAGEVGYQIQKHCPTISPRYLRAISRLGKLKEYALSEGYTEEEMRALDGNEAAKAKRDALVAEYLFENGVVEGDPDSYCRLGLEEIEKNTLTGWLLRAN